MLRYGENRLRVGNIWFKTITSCIVNKESSRTETQTYRFDTTDTETHLGVTSFQLRDYDIRNNR